MKRVDTSAVERLGYTVEVTESENLPYQISGKRGAVYSLMRNIPNPHMLFAVSARNFTSQAKVHGYTWFTDKGGVLKPVR